MPESTCLHIQDRESGPIRVVELPWISVRIGRAAYCEVCLPDDRLPEETCRLTRRGRTWSLVPASGRGVILLEGRPLDGPCPLPFDVPFRMGPYCLTLRHDVAAEPDWELYPATAPSSGEPSPSLQSTPVPREASSPLSAEIGDASTATAPEGPGRPTGDADRWRARWKAAEDHFKSRAARLETGSSPRAAHFTRAYTPPEPVRRASPPPAPAAPPVEPPAPPAPTPVVHRIEPTWTIPRPDRHLSTPRVVPPMRPAPSPASSRQETIDTASPPPRPEEAHEETEAPDHEIALTPAIECEAGEFDEILAAAVDALPSPPTGVVQPLPIDPLGVVDDGAGAGPATTGRRPRNDVHHESSSGRSSERAGSIGRRGWNPPGAASVPDRGLVGEPVSALRPEREEEEAAARSHRR